MRNKDIQIENKKCEITIQSISQRRQMKRIVKCEIKNNLRVTDATISNKYLYKIISEHFKVKRK